MVIKMNQVIPGMNRSIIKNKKRGARPLHKIALVFLHSRHHNGVYNVYHPILLEHIFNGYHCFVSLLIH